MKVQRVERHIITKESEDYGLLDNLCFDSKNLYNYVTYILRQAFIGNHEAIPEFADLIKEGKFIDEYDLSTRLAKMNQVDFRNLKTQCAQQVIKLVYKNFKSFYKAIKAYKKCPSKFTGRPKLPKYKDKKKGRNILVYTNQCAKIKNKMIYLSKLVHLEEKTNIAKFQQIRIVHKGYYIVVEIVYEKFVDDIDGIDNRTNAMGIDLGINNLATITSDNGMSLIINGRNLKSINQYYNKRLAKLKEKYSKFGRYSGTTSERLTLKRNNLIEDYMHKTTKYICQLAIMNNIKYCFVGLNKGWKQESNMGTVNNQKFVQIPFSKFISMLEYKLAEHNIYLITLNESHTSKCSFIDNEKICHHDEYVGKRIKRGLFKSASGKVINADINGSLNILKRGLENSFEFNKRFFNPIRIKDINKNLMSLKNANCLDNKLEVCVTPTSLTDKKF